jgi:pilus assembly protein TadC
MNEGYSELAAYDEFASRCDSISYKVFISLVKQAVVKGNAGLEQLLYEEIDKAQRERNNRIRTLASEAETKLLLPMFMMLLTVLVFVMVPAFLGLNG